MSESNSPARDLVRSFLANDNAAARSEAEKQVLIERIKAGLIKQNAVLVAHYYTSPEIQALAQATGGCVSDSLEMARFGKQHEADTLIVAGVKFMGETSKILSPEKRVLMPSLEATCSLDIGCPPDEFAAFCDQYPDRKVVVYANTSAAVKARADWVVTSSIAVDVIEHLHEQGEKIVWGPDKHLGSYIAKQTGADMVLWDGACIVHEEFKASGLDDLKAVYPNAGILVHPESPAAVVEKADFVGSTSQIINAAKEMDHEQFIVATDQGIFYRMMQEVPDKELIIAPTGGNGANCKSCANCPWMAMNELENIAEALDVGAGEIEVTPSLIEQALIPLNRMVNFSVAAI